MSQTLTDHFSLLELPGVFKPVILWSPVASPLQSRALESQTWKKLSHSTSLPLLAVDASLLQHHKIGSLSSSWILPLMGELITPPSTLYPPRSHFTAALHAPWSWSPPNVVYNLGLILLSHESSSTIWRYLSCIPYIKSILIFEEILSSFSCTILTW